jgi:Tfp pilus assembly protein PilF
MRIFLGKALLFALVIGLAPYVFADLVPDVVPEQAPKNIKFMTVAELDRAGDERRKLRDYPEAVRYFQEALRRDKKNASIYNKLGLTHLFDGNMDEAKHAFGKAISLKPDYTDAINNLGVAYFNQRRLGSAVKYFRKAIELNETRAAFRVNLGVVLFNQKKIELAMKEYTRALELDPDVLERSARAGITVQIANPDARARFYFELAKVQAARGDIEDCLRRLKAAKDHGYRRLADVYRDELFRSLWDYERLHEIVAPPAS